MVQASKAMMMVLCFLGFVWRLCWFCDEGEEDRGPVVFRGLGTLV